MGDLHKIQTELLEMIEGSLSPNLTYHGLHHTLDVLKVCQFYIKHYRLNDREAHLLELAAVGHDIGFIQTYKDHEDAGVKIVTEMMTKYGYNKADRDLVTALIMATKIPQSPKTFLAEIICDADLDYLGRKDFKEIGKTLLKEWRTYGIIPNIDEVFDDVQISFLRSHRYHTGYARINRTPIKLDHLKNLEDKLGQVNVAVN